MKFDRKLPLTLVFMLMFTASVAGAGDGESDRPTLQPISIKFHGASQRLSDLRIRC